MTTTRQLFVVRMEVVRFWEREVDHLSAPGPDDHYLLCWNCLESVGLRPSHPGVSMKQPDDPEHRRLGVACAACGVMEKVVRKNLWQRIVAWFSE